MLLTLTPAGYGLVQQAQTGGSLVVVSDFKVASAVGYADFAHLGWPQGAGPGPSNAPYSSRPTDAIALSQDQMCWICDIDPEKTEWPIGELALYVGGTLFAKGRLPARVDKHTGQHVRICATVYGRGIARACTQEYAADSPVDRYLTVDQLPTADAVKRNNVIIVRGKQASPTVWAPVVLVKTSNVDSTARWAVVNGKHVYSGPCENIAPNQLRIPNNFFGKNIVMVQDLITKSCRSVASISQNGVITLTVPTTMTSIEIWAAHSFDSDGDCDYSQLFDAPDDPPLDPPAPLCEGTPIAPPPPPPDNPIVIISPAVPPAPPPVVSHVGYGVHFCSRPIADPYREDELGKQGHESLKQRLVAASPYGINVFNRWFVTSQSISKQMMVSLAFRSDDTKYPYSAFDNGYIAPEIITGVNKVVTTAFSDRVSIGNYSSLLDTLVASTKPTVGNIRQRLNAIVVSKGYRLVVYEHKDFGGRIIADLRGPFYLLSRQAYNTIRYGDPDFVPIYRRPSIQLLPASLPPELELPAQQLTDPEVSTGPYIEPGSPDEPPQRLIPPSDQFSWVFNDVCWAGPIGRQIDGKVRRVSDQEMTLRTSAIETLSQAVPFLLEPDMWRWQGSFKVLIDSEAK